MGCWLSHTSLAGALVIAEGTEVDAACRVTVLSVMELMSNSAGLGSEY
jgi:hypothetical protein